jgi:hypothetical protein
VPQPSTVRKFAKALAVPAGDVEEFRETIRQEACRNAPLEVLAQGEQMEVSELEVVDATIIRVAAQRPLREVMQYLVRSGHEEDVDWIYHEVRAEATTREEASIVSDTIS